MKRRLFNVASLISLALCFASAVLWYRRSTNVDYFTASPSRYSALQLISRPTGLRIICATTPEGDGDNGPGIHYLNIPAHRSTRPIPFKFDATRGRNMLGGDFVGIMFPHGAAVMAAALLPTLWIVVRVKRRQGVAGMCAECGYDLRATPDRCPECGAGQKKPIGSSG